MSTYSGCCPPRSQTSGCLYSTTGNCVTYTGSSISGTNIHTGDNYNKVVNDLITYIKGGATGILTLTTTGTTGPATYVLGTLNIPQYSNTGSNGISVNGIDVNLGQTVGQVGSPGQLLYNTEIPLNTFSLSFIDTNASLILSSSGGDTQWTYNTLPTFKYTNASNVQFGTNQTDNTALVQINGRAADRIGLTIRRDATNTFSTPIWSILDSTGAEYMSLRASATTIYFNKAFSASDTGVNNVGIGVGTFAANTSGSWCYAFGKDNLGKNTTGNYNFAAGGNGPALGNNTIGQKNTAIGTAALGSNVDGSENVGIGVNPIYNNVSGGNNVGIGSNVLFQRTSSFYNIGIGSGALQESLVATNNSQGNVAIGYGSLQQRNWGNYNIGLGYFVGFGAVGGIGNILIGGSAFTSGTMTDNNILIGTSTGISGAGVIVSSNIIIGANSKVSTGSVSNSTVLGTGGTVGVSNIVLLGLATQNIIIGLTTATTDSGDRVQVTGVVKASGYKSPTSAKSSSFTADGLAETYLVSTTGGAVVVTMSPTTLNGSIVNFKKLTNDANNITLTPSSGTIQDTGAATATLAFNSQGQTKSVRCDGTNFYVIT